MAARFLSAFLPLHLLCALVALVATPARAVEPLKLYTEDYPPFNWADKRSGKATGLSVDIVDELMRRARVATDAPVLLPWARGLASTIRTPHSCLFSSIRIEEREPHFFWIGPLAHHEWVMFARRTDRLVLASLADARPYQVGTLIADASIPILNENRVTVNIVPSHRQNLAKLRAQRIGLWAVGRLPGLYLMAEMGYGDMEQVLSFAKVDMYLACNRAMGEAEALRLNEVLRAMYRDGTVQRIYDRYGYGADAPHLRE